MGKEIERKFLLKNDAWRELATGTHYVQGYLNSNPERAVRIRIIGEKGFLTIKGKSEGAMRTEFEYEIPHAEASQMLHELCEKPLIDKHRYKIKVDEYTWEVDEFHAENQGLILAEIELPAENIAFQKPQWIGQEVTHDTRYFNSNLIKNPFSAWKS